ncbi:hypothetical protein KPL78_08725 [Roseomonas sp. HJA6]|uniref:Uncharacterized protein n=1 Tax=Roseomonas alba TaxID=2846776 RepID=A0ABS7A6P9_9PROT|nr:hypothetical protein [Neoroseomonas alba]MBW6397926.1 hypothetical protein [Neoroseomonas alba]
MMETTIKVLIASDDATGPESGLVQSGATGGGPHAALLRRLGGKVVDISATMIADSVEALAKAISPTLQQKMPALAGLTVQEISIGCTITGQGEIMAVGAGMEASLVVTFRIA